MFAGRKGRFIKSLKYLFTDCDLSSIPGERFGDRILIFSNTASYVGFLLICSYGMSPDSKEVLQVELISPTGLVVWLPESGS